MDLSEDNSELLGTFMGQIYRYICAGLATIALIGTQCTSAFGQATVYVDINAETTNPYGQCGGSVASVTLGPGAYRITPIISAYTALSPWASGHCQPDQNHCWIHSYDYKIGSTVYGRGNSTYSATQTDAFNLAVTNHNTTPEILQLSASTTIQFYYGDDPNCGNCANGGACTCDASGSCYSDNRGGVSLRIDDLGWQPIQMLFDNMSD
jgi:hypothetical protein